MQGMALLCVIPVQVITSAHNTPHVPFAAACRTAHALPSVQLYSATLPAAPLLSAVLGLQLGMATD
jgi:hypothetical protein